MIRRLPDVSLWVVECHCCGIQAVRVASSLGTVRADLEADGWRLAVTDGHTTDRCPGCAG